MKSFRTFSLIVAENQNWDVGYSGPSDDECWVKYAEFASPTLKCLISPMPPICRSRVRKAKQKEEAMFLSPEPVKCAG